MSVLVAKTTVSLSDPKACMAALLEHFAEHDAEVVRGESRGEAVFEGRKAAFEAQAGALGMRAEAEDETALAFLKTFLAAHLLEAAAGETPEIVWTGDGAGAGRLPNFRELTVLGIRDVTPRMRRITFAGEDLESYAAGGLHIKILIPPPGIGTPEWPTVAASGLPVWPEEERRPAVRTYTVRRVDPRAGEMDIDFVIHGDGGPGTTFALRAARGDRLGIIGPGGGEVPEADWYLLAGDETALPAIARILETLPREARGTALIEVADAGEDQALAHPPGMAVRWLHRDGAPAGTTDLVVEAVRQVAWPEDGARVFAWAGAEYAAFRALRRHWREEIGLDRSQHLAVGYWRRGTPQGDGKGARG
ncbi:siderophore-interacting protein [Kaustia mangrovi]|uniref:Siderophore-interacting protein n=1 Tax=Kaustia mangrovi TaxID=2593653 RepID=A0A7S8HBH9_9HYPH|nr:siderophore-interacting protein [Kaustia mangrovi]QPC42615.1 siderophore-interacting protein [Kaustia mangrovi]